MYTIIIPWMAGNERREEIFRLMVTNSLLKQTFNKDDEIIVVEQSDKVNDIDEEDFLCGIQHRHIWLESDKPFNKSY